MRTRVHVTRQDFLAGAGIAGDQHRRLARRHLLGELDHARHGVVAVDQFARIVGDRGQHRRDQLRIGRQRDVLLGAGMNRGDRGARVGRGAASHDRHMNVLGFEPAHQFANGDGDVHHQQIGAAAGAQHGQPLRDVGGVSDGRALLHGELGRGGELAAERADDEEPHGLFLPGARYERSALMISVIVTPSFSSTSTTSPRATRRLLT
jgi:hypothetical protein